MSLANAHEDVVNLLKGMNLDRDQMKSILIAAMDLIKNPTPEEVKMVQAKRLISLGFHEAREMNENEFLKAVPLPKEGKTGHILVISPRCVSISAAMALIEVDGMKGKNFLDPASLKDVVETPAGMFYWRYDLLYKPYCGKSPATCEKLIKEEHRLQGTANEAVYVVAQHPKILKEQFLDCPGSHGHRGRVPYLSLCDGRPKLSASGADGSIPSYGSFSFGSDS